MVIKPELLEIYACPACHARLEVTTENNGLRCVACHRIYPIRDEIPVLLVEEAILEESPAAA